jgi:nucleoside-diphosphate-sugar epimerase
LIRNGKNGQAGGGSTTKIMATEKPVVLITGSDGRIGKAIVANLTAVYTVVGLTRSCGDNPDCIRIDLTTDEAVTDALSQVRERYGAHIASVIHLAAYYDFSGEASPLYEEVNVKGTQRLLRELQSFQVEQFVYASTMLVHAPTEPGYPINEDWRLEPKWPYPQSKLEAERTVVRQRGAIPEVLMRIAGVYTDDCDLPALAFQIQRIYERQTLSHVFPGDMSHGQALVYLDDVARSFRRAVDRRAALPPESVFLIGESITESYQALQNLIGRLIHGEPWETREIPKTVAAAGAWLQNKVEDIVPDTIDRGIEPFVKPFMVEIADDHYELDTARANADLGWQTQQMLRRKLPTMIGKLQKEPVQWYRRNRIPLPAWLESVADKTVQAPSVIAQYHALARKEHQQTLWCAFANAALGLWLISSPATLGLAQNWMQPGELVAPNQRGLVFSDTFMTASDIVAGLLIVIFGLLSMKRDFGWARWTVAAIGCWLLFAPLVFWTTSAAAYANDTLVGMLVIVFALAIGAPPGINPAGRMTGPDAPPGWDYSPSSWSNRIPIVLLACIGLFISRYLAAFQLGHIDEAWDPFFGDGTERIITSWVSEAWPVSDAGLGAATYALEIVTGVIGDKRRWRTMPWLVLLFGLLIVPLAFVSLFFIIIQPVWLGTWCTLCLAGAAAMVWQIPYSFDEILATLQFLEERRQEGKSLWYIFFHGDTMPDGSVDYSDNFEASPGMILREMLSAGVNVPWNLAASLAIGVALMCTQLIFGTEGDAADNDHVAGLLVVTFSVSAMAEVARPLRFINIAFGAWLIVSPWFIDGYSGIATAASVLAGIALIWLALPPGGISNHYGSWDRVIRFNPMARRDWKMSG